MSTSTTASGPIYIWTKDIVGNTSCYSKQIYKITFYQWETKTCTINSAGLTDSGTQLSFSITATCNCQSQGTCKTSPTNGTDTDRATLSMQVLGSTAATYTLASYTHSNFRDLIVYISPEEQDDVYGQGIYSSGTIKSYQNGWLHYCVGYGRSGTTATDTATISKIVADSTTIYNGGFVQY